MLPSLFSPLTANGIPVLHISRILCGAVLVPFWPGLRTCSGVLARRGEGGVGERSHVSISSTSAPPAAAQPVPAPSLPQSPSSTFLSSRCGRQLPAGAGWETDNLSSWLFAGPLGLSFPWRGPAACCGGQEDRGGSVTTSQPCPSLAAGSQDSLLEITFRSGALPVLCDPTTPQPEDSHLPQLGPGSGFPSALGSPIGRNDCLVKLECYRFLPGSGPHAAEPALGSLELLKFRESGIASEYESNTDESEERDSWSQEEPPRLLNVQPRQDLGDSLEDEIAV